MCHLPKNQMLDFDQFFEFGVLIWLDNAYYEVMNTRSQGVKNSWSQELNMSSIHVFESSKKWKEAKVDVDKFEIV